MQVRLQKFLADAGVASRRASEEVILEARVKVNGQVVKTLGTKIDPEHDSISLDGKQLKPKRKLYIALHKPAGFICSRLDPENRPCAQELLPAEWREVYSVGRLDYDSEGLLLFTNDGDFSLKLTHPRYGIQKIYHVTVRGQAEQSHVRAMEKGIYHEGELLRAHRARVLHSASGGGLLEVILMQGKNREVRRMCEAQGLKVDRLVRVQIGSVKLGELPRGRWRALSPAEVTGLLNWKDRPTHLVQREERTRSSEPRAERRVPSRAPRPERPFRSAERGNDRRARTGETGLEKRVRPGRRDEARPIRSGERPGNEARASFRSRRDFQAGPPRERFSSS
ncbi:MAG TPA: pseudouridine synthase, partial [Methylomirabilota bacterium]|nr:pseudouridine synthase [Methylomirabilota bacterium]